MLPATLQGGLTCRNTPQQPGQACRPGLQPYLECTGHEGLCGVPILPHTAVQITGIPAFTCRNPAVRTVRKANVQHCAWQTLKHRHHHTSATWKCFLRVLLSCLHSLCNPPHSSKTALNSTLKPAVNPLSLQRCESLTDTTQSQANQPYPCLRDVCS